MIGCARGSGVRTGELAVCEERTKKSKEKEKREERRAESKERRAKTK